MWNNGAQGTPVYERLVELRELLEAVSVNTRRMI
jgi:hypothetical protein